MKSHCNIFGKHPPTSPFPTQHNRPITPTASCSLVGSALAAITPEDDNILNVKATRLVCL